MMTLDNYQSLVEPKILERGLEYYNLGAILEFNAISSNCFVAIVESFYSDRTYRVEVDLSKREICNSSCSCPYDWGNICKHEVAVYLEIKDYKAIESEVEMPKNDQIALAKELLSNADDVDVIAFVRDYLSINEKFREAFILDFK
ncbi:SWIM zinc finger family protein [Aureispira anguillae]|uniref:SWIM-type domain-containing protein n=1 Tax=Aureispira anguillae TaxID=2864201 RepID=A0A915YKM4_9BACT|nr:SWIM zinc finger family protein [Aureispira anguillae]BDS14686.1 hypothetical protein AsAng_0054670 [Aureispira anguillae]